MSAKKPKIIKYRLSSIYGEPKDINEKGTAWWLDNDLTKYANEKLGIEYKVLIYESKCGYSSRVLLDEHDSPIAHTPSMEVMLYKIDVLSLIDKFNNVTRPGPHC